jgi:hypothetical protein
VRADHIWAADELWLGMTVPLHQAWVRGSAALIDSPLHAPPPSDDAAAEVGRKLHANGRPLIDGAGVCQLDRALYFVPRLIAQPPDAVDSRGDDADPLTFSRERARRLPRWSNG